jgi:glutamate-ammonia-ligase adenylyltransferase
MLAQTFDSVAKATVGGGALALHIFDTPARGLPGSASVFGFIGSNGEAEAREGFARTFLAALEEIGDGYFALAPDVSHRPAGVGGPLAPDVAAFRSFVQSEAIAYDQILLARARVIAGAEKAQSAAIGALRTAVSNPKRADILFRDLDRARAQRLRRDKAASEWDIDQVEGGLSDVELIISTLVYRHAAAQPGVQGGDVNAALDILVRAGAVPAGVAETLKSARAFWMRLATARALARWSDPQREPVRARFAALLARAAQVEQFSQVRPIMRGYAEEVGRLYSQLVLGRPALSLVSGA